VKCWVWWSKNFSNWIESYENNQEIFDSFKGHVFQFTINSPSELEKNIIISLEDRFEQIKWLIDKFGIPSINYRFDPIIFYKTKGSEDIKNNLDKFDYIIHNIAKQGVKEMTFSFATIYSKVRNRMNSRGFMPIDLKSEQKATILTPLIKICEDNRIQMKACCQADLLSIKGIAQAHCIDAVKIEKLIGESIPKKRDTGQRKECGCYKSKDIGGYTGIFRCNHNCDYCYASPAKR